MSTSSFGDKERVWPEIGSSAADVQQGLGFRRVLTYGTYDLLHYGHIRLLRRAAALGDYLIVALSTDKFNALKGKEAFYPYALRCEMLKAIRYVDLVIPEDTWGQKRDDVLRYHVDTVVMGADWKDDNRFMMLSDICELVFLDRTDGISTTGIKERLDEGLSF
ncbi:MAG: adenylyltransferase/cytidyltransferase family protein [Actinomycetia bacterium]|nr:adenylyltransferase/cytidyltransferase family protein [Actinomycetes bacterium]